MPVVNREVVLPVDRERAWELITEPAELEEWLGDDVEFEAAEDAPMRVGDREGVVEEVTEFERIVFRWGDSRVEWQLEDAIAGGTRFLVTEHRYAADTITWGPWITTADAISDVAALAITTHVNGELRQDGNTRDLIFGPEELVAFISETCTLEPGAIILTGTPSGVGEAADPPRYLQPGDTVRIEVEGLGAIEHDITD